MSTKFSFVIHQMLMRGTVKNSCEHLFKTSSPLSFPGENSQSTDDAIGNDFRQVVVTVKSQQSAKSRVYSKAFTRVCAPS